MLEHKRKTYFEASTNVLTEPVANIGIVVQEQSADKCDHLADLVDARITSSSDLMLMLYCQFYSNAWLLTVLHLQLFDYSFCFFNF